MVVLAEPGGNNSGSLQINSPDFSRRISPGSDGFAVIALAAGSYRVAGLPAVTVPAGSVFLYPGVLSPDGSFRELTPADQRIAMGRLSDYVGFESWFGRDYLNFGPYRPKQYLSGRYHALTIESEPEGASIRIDELLWGETPQTIELIAGKYLVEIEAPGHRPFRRIISLDGPLSLSPELIPRETEAPDAKERYSIMVAPIRSMDESEDAYGDIIAATMAANFTADPRLEAIRGSAGEADGDYPDFSSAEEVGADLLVAGRYHLDGQSLYLEAILYEATTRRVKFAQTYLSEAGLAVFDSIDTVSAGFAEAVSRVLPAPGEPIVEKEVFVGDELIAYERSIFREQMLQNRLDRKNLFGVKVGFGGIDDEITLENGDERGFGGGGNPPNQIRLDYQRILTRRLSLSATTLMHIQGISSDEEELDGPSFIPTVILMLGPEFAFRSIASEVYFTPVLMLGIPTALLGNRYLYQPVLGHSVALVYRSRTGCRLPLLLLPEEGRPTDIRRSRYELRYGRYRFFSRR